MHAVALATEADMIENRAHPDILERERMEAFMETIDEVKGRWRQG